MMMMMMMMLMGSLVVRTFLSSGWACGIVTVGEGNLGRGRAVQEADAQVNRAGKKLMLSNVVAKAILQRFLFGKVVPKRQFLTLR